MKTRCQGCDVILGGLVKASVENPNRCEDCLHFEDRIKDTCACGNFIDNNPKYFKANGNFCEKCMHEVYLAGRGKKRKKT